MAQLDSKVFQILDNRHTRSGIDVSVAANVTTLEPGMLVRYSGGSTVILGDTVNVDGIAFGQPHAFDYIGNITDKVFDAGDPVVVVHGGGEALLGSHLFVSGTLPSAGSPVYAAASGLWSTTGTKLIGQCIARQSVSQPFTVGGTGIDVARVRFDLS